MSGPTVPTGERRHWAEVWTPAGAPVHDGDGSYTTAWTRGLDWAVQVRPASQQELARLGTSIGSATHLVTGRFHDGVTLAARLVLRGRTFEVTSVLVPDELDIETVAVCAELVGTPPPTEAG